MGKSLNQERITNISFFIDEKYNVINANRNLLRLLNTTKSTFKITDFLNGDSIYRFYDVIAKKEKYFAGKLCARDTQIDCLFIFDYLYDVIRVNLVLLINLYESYNLLDFNTKQYEALLTSLEHYYWIYDPSEKSIIFKNTRELGVLFQGSIEKFFEFYVDYFNIDNAERVYKHLVYDLDNRWGDKRYKFLTKNNDSIILKTKSFTVNGKTYFLGSYNFEADVLSGEKYIEKRDSLTGVYNKQTIEEMVINYIDAKKEFTLVMIDVDKFKQFNDNFGHAYGDRVLAIVANEIKDAIKTKGHVGRIGGDEFLCIVEEVNEEALRTIITDLRLAVQWALPAANTDGVVTCSIGIARYPLNTDNYDRLFDLADKCLNIAKNKGRNCYIIYKPLLHDSVIQASEEAQDESVKTSDYFNNVRQQYNILQAIENEHSNMFEMLASYLSVDKITIYDNNLDLVKIFGDASNEPRKKFIKKEDYFKFFNNYGYFLMDNANILDTLDKEKLDMYLSDNIATSLEVAKIDKQGNIIGLICFDKYKPAKTFLEDKVKFALFMSELLIK